MQITFDEKKRLDTNPIFNLFVQGENMAESIRIVGPKMVGALDLSQLRMAVRVTSAAYETMVEKTLEQTVSDEGTITLVWNVDRQFTSNPGHVQVMLVGYGNNEEVIKITSSGIEVKEDETFISAPQGNTWEQILREMQELATQASASQTAAAASADRAAASEQVAISKAEEIENAAEQTAANAKAAAQSAQEAAESAASVDPGTLVKTINGTAPTSGNVDITKIAALQNLIAPVGYIFAWNAVDGGPDLSKAENVAAYFGFGTWQAYGAGRVLTGLDPDTPQFTPAGKTAGQIEHTLTEDELPVVSPQLLYAGTRTPVTLDAGGTPGHRLTFSVGNVTANNLISTFGGGQPHTNLQPYIVVYYWQRIA